MEVEDVEDIMKILADKSLVYQHPREPGSDELLYSVHDLQSDFLKLTTNDLPVNVSALCVALQLYSKPCFL